MKRNKKKKQAYQQKTNMYADDSDFLTEDNSRSEVLKKIVKDCLGTLNLKVNKEKTEETIIKRERGKK